MKFLTDKSAYTEGTVPQGNKQDGNTKEKCADTRGEVPTLKNIKDSLDIRICDWIDGATNPETYREFIVNGYRKIGSDLPVWMNLDEATNEELNDIVEELEWLLAK